MIVFVGRIFMELIALLFFSRNRIADLQKALLLIWLTGSYDVYIIQ
jgi:hypothetical protein